ncbi:Rho GTPase-activating protein 6 [Homalodisca vitripennis]|nr:Rho GTPase-activating protein 6 [Homalodisca vitripennis]
MGQCVESKRLTRGGKFLLAGDGGGLVFGVSLGQCVRRAARAFLLAGDGGGLVFGVSLGQCVESVRLARCGKVVDVTVEGWCLACRWASVWRASGSRGDGGGLVFGVSLGQCVESERLARGGKVGDESELRRKSHHGSRSSFNSLIDSPAKEERVQWLSQDIRIKQRRAWLLLGWVTVERSYPCKQLACPVGGGSEVTSRSSSVAQDECLLVNSYIRKIRGRSTEPCGTL